MPNPVATLPTAQPVDKLLAIRASDAQKLLDCLAKLPCGDVFGLVSMLLTLQEAPKAIEVVVQPNADIG